jgi:endonuclease/exonuclease/phosphatase family metal-dependent hydrolase
VRITAATYNVQSFRGGVDRVAAAVEGDPGTPGPDLLLLQECGPKSVLHHFAAEVGMEAVSSHRLFHRVRNAVLYRPPWRLHDARVHDLSRQGRMAPRGFVAARLRLAGVTVLAVSAHLGLSQAERERHARELTDELLPTDAAIVVGVDLNEGPEGIAARWIGDRLFDTWTRRPGEGGGETFPAEAPTARIDDLFVSAEVSVVRTWVGDERVAGASDHRPVFAELEIEEGGRGRG